MDISSVQSSSILAAAASARQERTPAQVAEAHELIKAVKQVNESEFYGNNSELTIVFDRQSRRPLVRLVDRETKEVLQQFPPEYVLRLAKEMKERYR